MPQVLVLFQSQHSTQHGDRLVDNIYSIKHTYNMIFYHSQSNSLYISLVVQISQVFIIIDKASTQLVVDGTAPPKPPVNHLINLSD